MAAPRLPRERTVGAAIRYRRQLKGLRIREVAERIGVTSAQMTRWELGREPVPAAYRARIAETLDCDPALFRPSTVELTRDERGLLADYRALRAIDRAAVRSLIARPATQERAPC